ncbi:MAG: DNA-formamidopyrimidine glycosylase [Candidatus Omnitrophica bacterium]|nr:DNA-formamidopyrimidine glycosylase [Candidatus Omnitrophota bacterium]MCM8825901.1 DNA-formamidopyrimidine glycosylase [Candidatus Omnitrophota bacterium]
MPELPEVETIKLQLRENILNKKIVKIEVKDKRVLKQIKPEEFILNVEGKTVNDIFRRGKVLIVKLSKDLFLIIHLRISGWLILGEKEEKLARVIFKFSHNKILNFCDQRVLGEIRLVENWQNLPIIKEMGPEPLEIKREEFIGLFKDKKTKIKPLLMDQNFLAGVGNVYAQESLFCAGIHPERSTQRLEIKELSKLYDCLISILKEAIEKKGSSVDTYRQIDGQEGNYVPFLKVYQRENKPCFRCNTPIKRKTISGRGTYFCPHCQK